MLICDVYDRNALERLQWANEYVTGKKLITHKYVFFCFFLNLRRVNSASAGNTHNTRKSPWETVDTSSKTQNIRVASKVPLALFVAVGLTRSCARFRLRAIENTWIFSFGVDSALLILKVWAALVATEDGGDTETLQMFNSQFYQQ